MAGRKGSRDELLFAAYAVAVRDGLEAVTARSVAAEAGTSHGLVFFHFESVSGLLLSLLDVLLAGALDAAVTPELAALPPHDRLRELLRVELEGMEEQRAAAELFFAYWLRREPAFRERIDGALDRYRGVFEQVCVEVCGPEQARTLATVVVSFVQGAAVQSVRDPGSYDPEGFLKALALLVPTAPPAPGPRRP
ncbi:MAG: hypothetical protein JWM64_2063 [Frankiales bacterium]|nr:hypothetical protein [Frankiales bacterium]